MEGTDAFIALVVSGSNAAVYACDVYLVVGERAVAADVTAGWILDSEGDERGALIRRGSFRPTPRFDRRGLVLEDEGFAMTKLVIVPNAVVSPTHIVAPDTIASPDDVSLDDVLRIPSPGGPIPIPNTPTSTATRTG